MKNSIIKTLLFVILVVILFSNCNKDDSANPSGIGQGTFTAKVDGVEFKPLVPLAGIVDIGGQLEAFSIGGANTSLSLSLNFWVPAGSEFEEITYQHNGMDCVTVDRICGSIISLDLSTTEGASTDADNGSVQIIFTSIDYRPGGSCIGTFSGILIADDQSIINVTDGRFNLKIEE